MKDTNQDQIGQDTWGRVWEGPKRELLAFFLWDENTTLSWQEGVHHPRSSTELCCPEFLLGFCYMLNHRPHDWTSFPATNHPPHTKSGDWAVITWPKVPTLWSHGWSFCSPAPSSAISVLSAQTQGWPEELVNGKDTWEILRVLEGPCWTLRTKTREVFCYPIIRII